MGNAKELSLKEMLNRENISKTVNQLEKEKAQETITTFEQKYFNSKETFSVTLIESKQMYNGGLEEALKTIKSKIDNYTKTNTDYDPAQLTGQTIAIIEAYVNLIKNPVKSNERNMPKVLPEIAFEVLGKIDQKNKEKNLATLNVEKDVQETLRKMIITVIERGIATVYFARVNAIKKLYFAQPITE
jgi:hypothetical protein